MQDRSLEEALLPLESKEGLEPSGVAAHLWAILNELHRDMNSLSRSAPYATVTDTQIDVINGLLHQIIRLLAQNGRAQNLRLLDKEKPLTTGDALIILGHYKGSLRSYRIGVLGEDEFSF